MPENTQAQGSELSGGLGAMPGKEAMNKDQKIELLEARLTDLRDEVYYQLTNGLPSLHRLKEEECRATAALKLIHE